MILSNTSLIKLLGRSPFLAQPTLSHFVLTKLYSLGYLKEWIQQNHDGLPQKSGLPQSGTERHEGAKRRAGRNTPIALLLFSRLQ